MRKTASKGRDGTYRVEGSSLPAEGYVRLPGVLNVFPRSRSAFLKGVRDGIYPQPVQLGPRTVAWRVEDIRKLLSDVDSGKRLW